jgi:hypothetical protein
MDIPDRQQENPNQLQFWRWQHFMASGDTIGTQANAWARYKGMKLRSWELKPVLPKRWLQSHLTH